MSSRLEKKCADLSWPHDDRRKRRSTYEYVDQNSPASVSPAKNARMNLIKDQEHMPKKNKPKKEATAKDYITKVR